MHEAGHELNEKTSPTDLQDSASVLAHLGIEELSAIFPFFIAWDSDFRITAIGPGMRKTSPGLQMGMRFTDVFFFDSPADLFSVSQVLAHHPARFSFRHREGQLSFFAQLLPHPSAQSGVFLATPHFSSTQDIAAAGLAPEDFPPHNSTCDLLALIETRQSTLQNLESLTESLRIERSKLEQANERLSLQEQDARKLALVAARTDNAVVLTDPEGKIEWVNEGFTRITGYLFEEVRGKSPGSFLQGPKTDAATVDFVRSRLAAEKSVSTEILNYRKNGSPYWLYMEIQPVRNSEGKLVNFMAVQRDVTRRRAEERRRGIQHAASQILATAGSVRQAGARILQSMSERIGGSLGFIWTLHPETSLMRCLEWWHNPQIDLSPLLTLSKSRQIDVGEWIPGLVWKAERPLWISKLTDLKRDERTPISTASGLHTVLAFPIFSNKSLQGVIEIFGEDMDEPDDAMLQVMSGIGNQIGQFMARRKAEEDLFHAKEVAERANEAKSLFLATMSHEIRTPLNGILGFTDLLLEAPLRPSEVEYVQTIRRSGVILLHIINDVLDFSRIESGGLLLENIRLDLHELVSQTMEIHSQSAHAKGLTFAWEIEDSVPQWITGDPARIRQILMNLAANAVKFTETGGVSIRVRSSDGRLSFSVRDTGIGFHQDQADLLFKPFQQGENRTNRRFGGTGLGLAICHRLLDLMGGGIEAESELGKGSVFRFHLPLVIPAGLNLPQAPVTARINTPPRSTASGRTILVAEDNPVNSRLIRILLEKMGFRVMIAENGLALIELFEKESHCVTIFMDIRMPLVDGIEATRRLRSGEAGEEGLTVPIIALTASVFPAEQKAFIASGMNYYLAKPLRPGDLLSGLRAVGVLTEA